MWQGPGLYNCNTCCLYMLSCTCTPSPSTPCPLSNADVSLSTRPTYQHCRSPYFLPQPQAGSVLKGEVRCAAPLSSTVGADPASRVFCRALFIMDYRDSDLFHLLEVGVVLDVY